MPRCPKQPHIYCHRHNTSNRRIRGPAAARRYPLDPQRLVYMLPRLFSPARVLAAAPAYALRIELLRDLHTAAESEPTVRHRLGHPQGEPAAGAGQCATEPRPAASGARVMLRHTMVLSRYGLEHLIAIPVPQLVSRLKNSWYKLACQEDIVKGVYSNTLDCILSRWSRVRSPSRAQARVAQWQSAVQFPSRGAPCFCCFA